MLSDYVNLSQSHKVPGMCSISKLHLLQGHHDMESRCGKIDSTQKRKLILYDLMVVFKLKNVYD